MWPWLNAGYTMLLLLDVSVQTTLLPLLLPSGPFKRSLYLPYDPPQDICVSAPTGSGKTLAYVLPIIEVYIFSYISTHTPHPHHILILANSH